MRCRRRCPCHGGGDGEGPAREVYAFWDGFQSLPRFMSDVASVQITGDRQSHWSLTRSRRHDAGMGCRDHRAADPTSRSPGTRRRGPRSTRQGRCASVRLPGIAAPKSIFERDFNPPGGELGKKIAGFFAEALGTKIGNDLRRFKQLVELGEIVHSDDSIIPGPNPAQPPPRDPAGAHAIRERRLRPTRAIDSLRRPCRRLAGHRERAPPGESR